jgi:hypothetical protein
MGRKEPGDGVEQCRLARTVWPDDGDDRMHGNAQFDRPQGDKAAKAHSQIGDIEKRSLHFVFDGAQIWEAAEAAAHGLRGLLVHGQRPDGPRCRDQPFAPVAHHQHQDQSENQLDRRGELDMLQPFDIDEATERMQPLRQIFEKPGLQDLKDERADHDAPDAADPAEDDHHQHHDRDWKHEHLRGRGLQFGDIEGAGSASKGGADRKDEEFETDAVDAHRGGRDLGLRGSPSRRCRFRRSRPLITR